MSTRQKIGLVMILVGGAGTAITLGYLGYLYIADTTLRYVVFIATFVVGVSLLVWGYSDLTAHQKNTRKKHNEIYNAPND